MTIPHIFVTFIEIMGEQLRSNTMKHDDFEKVSDKLWYRQYVEMQKDTMFDPFDLIKELQLDDEETIDLLEKHYGWHSELFQSALELLQAKCKIKHDEILCKGEMSIETVSQLTEIKKTLKRIENKLTSFCQSSVHLLENN